MSLTTLDSRNLTLQNSAMSRQLSKTTLQKSRELDWDDLRYLLLIGRGGNLSAAARRAGVNQTTVARRLAAAETALGARLFDRIEGGFHPTAAGVVALAHAERVERELGELRREIGGVDLAAAGTVRVTAVPILVNHLLVPGLAAFRRRFPKIELELVAEPRGLSLGKREADIALRLARPQQGAALTRRLGQLDYAVFAARDASAELPWITYEGDLAHLPQARWMAREARGAGPAMLRFNDAEAILQAVLCGLGRSLLPSFLAAIEPRLQRQGKNHPVLSREIWLLVHPELRRLARIEAVISWLEEIVATLSGRRRRLRN